MKKHNTFKAMVQPLVEIRISLQMQSCAQIKMVETTELRLVRLEWWFQIIGPIDWRWFTGVKSLLILL